ncbi:uncharacterized protein ACA1_220680 [Acanthamoeba castellanii str. Neff]|uniref:25S rRNA (uridine-N(3))-methyltransferase BMT5-like domain-containing protein n=1 Tax=Acanthamoeba castellanii (strain ATCC 30010 / Neff) TaxID=1257118 RepID=L8GQW3_ACACF|nr:uncharacterized protein ACA1_220680 [Acanthamoeba castellanii str. Neff]ELR15307.1 hypothetical protein ACA1_220680 [Acanthamoeba castellanii str. Neff]
MARGRGGGRGGGSGGGRGKGPRRAPRASPAAFGGASASSSISSTSSSSFLAINKLLHAANCNPKSVGPYTNKLDILIVGDGDLSFSRALAYSIGGSRLTATCYDSLNAFKSKYRSSLANISELKQLEVQTYFGVDATRLEEQKWLNDPKKATERKQYHRIVFNFPHAGQDDEESRAAAVPRSKKTKTKKPKHAGDDVDKKKRKRGVGGGNIPQHEIVKRNQKLLYEFFVSAAPWLLPGGLGQIHVALRTSTHYKQWDIEELARKAGLVLKKTEPFQASLFPGYENKRTASADLVRGAPATDNAEIYMFIWPGATSPPLPQWPTEVEEDEDEESSAEEEEEEDMEEDDNDDGDGEEVEEQPKAKAKPQPQRLSNRIQAKRQQKGPVQAGDAEGGSRRDNNKRKERVEDTRGSSSNNKSKQSQKQPANKNNKRKERDEEDGGGNKKGQTNGGGPAKKAKVDGGGGGPAKNGKAEGGGDGLTRKERRALRGGGRGGREVRPVVGAAVKAAAEGVGAAVAVADVVAEEDAAAVGAEHKPRTVSHRYG